MKKAIILATLLFMLCSNVHAATSEVINGDFIQKSQNRIDRIGFRILNYNGIEKRTVFDFDTRNTKNAYSRSTDRQIVIFRGLYNRLESDDEVAAILAHEISHSVDSYNGIFRGAFTSWSYSFAPKNFCQYCSRSLNCAFSQTSTISKVKFHTPSSAIAG